MSRCEWQDDLYAQCNPDWSNFHLFNLRTNTLGKSICFAETFSAEVNFEVFVNNLLHNTIYKLEYVWAFFVVSRQISFSHSLVITVWLCLTQSIITHSEYFPLEKMEKWPQLEEKPINTKIQGLGLIT